MKIRDKDDGEIYEATFVAKKGIGLIKIKTNGEEILTITTASKMYDIVEASEGELRQIKGAGFSWEISQN